MLKLLGARRRSAFVAAVLAATVPVAAMAGTKGGLYEFGPLLKAPHPFAQPQRPPPPAPATTPATPTETPQAPVNATQSTPTATAQAKREKSATAEQPAASDGYDINRQGLLGWTAPYFTGPYMRLSLGGGRVSDTDSDFLAQVSEQSWDAGFAGEIAIGNYFDRQFRLEVAGSYGKFGLEEARLGNQVTKNADMTVSTLMLRGLYEFVPRIDHQLVPYIGLGLGGAEVISDDFRLGGVVFPGFDEVGVAAEVILGSAFYFNKYSAVTTEAQYLVTTVEDLTRLSLLLGLKIDF